jgi:hypothetical protein
MEKKRANDRDRIRRMSNASKATPDGGAALRARVAEVERDLRAAQKVVRAHDAEREEREAMRRAVAEVEVPTWLVSTGKPKKGPGVPSLLLTDWHIGEVVRPERINGVNAFNRDIASDRLKRAVAGALDLTLHHMVNPTYPGIVVPLGGDMVSGYIHEELMVTNWGDARDMVKEASRLIIWALEKLGENFEQLFVPCVTGNHGRLTKKMQAKRRVGTSLDAMVYDRVAEYFANRKNVRFAIAEGTGVLYKVYNHRYLLTHGDPASLGVKGGDGFIGSIGPIIRGLKKLSGRNGLIGLGFDTLVIGHYHQHWVRKGLVVGGTLKGYDEYADSGVFDVEEPSQALWFTHPERGVTCHWPVAVNPKGRKFEGDWLSVFSQ